MYSSQRIIRPLYEQSPESLDQIWILTEKSLKDSKEWFQVKLKNQRNYCNYEANTGWVNPNALKYQLSAHNTLYSK
jgi:hypothetical protein